MPRHTGRLDPQSITRRFTQNHVESIHLRTTTCKRSFSLCHSVTLFASLPYRTAMLLRLLRGQRSSASVTRNRQMREARRLSPLEMQSHERTNQSPMVAHNPLDTFMFSSRTMCNAAIRHRPLFEGISHHPAWQHHSIPQIPTSLHACPAHRQNVRPQIRTSFPNPPIPTGRNETSISTTRLPSKVGQVGQTMIYSLRDLQQP
ncbi:uncharacterized protein M421DRAFT_231314 [Didymella exigua CBS 183.55]|uniref:Uncharacterized protein n=1 Tax=Didymella exigua CBS 183.55 TaxID=1150837 RepID=A0A6A5RED4_9PLEO|nr:uncharacterized protein M421DRAFT_231314 [Didymella exigua CBS 183.55]KAF1925779.1 hypothetical protein M421DRAFT_231314 [Didymella exigua CBS 183.55]